MGTGEDVTVRTASPGDVEDWLDLFDEVAAEGRWIGAEAPVDRVERRRSFEHLLTSPDALLLVAQSDSHVVGLLSARLRRGVVQFGMLVGERWRGHRIGPRLLEACLGWAVDRHAHKVFLEVWPHNEAAISLYRKFGFVEEGRLRRHYRRRSGELWDSLQMGLVLDHTSPGSGYP